MFKKIQKIKDKCVKANSLIRVNHTRCMNCGYGFGFCKCPNPLKYTDREIGLSDILYALNINSTDKRWRISVSSNFMRIEFNKDFALYNLLCDLEKQNKECINFIYNLI